MKIIYKILGFATCLTGIAILLIGSFVEQVGEVLIRKGGTNDKRG